METQQSGHLEAPAGRGGPAVPSLEKPVPHRRAITAALMLVMVLASLEQTVTSTAMTRIVADLQGLEHISWVVSIYLLACTVSMPLYGRLADTLGRKRVIMGAILLFTLGSVCSGAAHSMVQLVIFRGVQGLGAGGIMPVVLTIIGDLFTIEERAKIQIFFSAIWGTASVAGPLLGAAIVSAVSWRWIFYINLPFGLLGMAVLAKTYHEREKPHSLVLDLPGAILLAVGCMAVLTAVSRLAVGSVQVPVAAGFCAVVVLALFVRNERRSSNPIMPASLFASPAIGPTLIGSGVMGVAVFALDVYAPVYVQAGRGMGVGAAAGVVTPVMLAWATSSWFAAPRVRRWGFRRLAIFGSSLILTGAAALVVCVALSAPYVVIAGFLLLCGAGFGPASMSYLLAAQSAVGYQQRGIVTSGITFFRTMGGAIGVGLLGAIFTNRMAGQLAHLRAYHVGVEELVNPDKRAALNIPPELVTGTHAAVCHSLLYLFIGMAAFTLVQLLVTLRMRDVHADHEVSRVEALESAAG